MEKLPYQNKYIKNKLSCNSNEIDKYAHGEPGCVAVLPSLCTVSTSWVRYPVPALYEQLLSIENLKESSQDLNGNEPLKRGFLGLSLFC